MTQKSRLDQIIAETHQNRRQREMGYREQALKMYPWVCGRCQREFDHRNVRELTVHHRDHDHDNNPSDGSNWELLCLYCHDNEHQRMQEIASYGTTKNTDGGEIESTFNPFAGLADLMKKKES
ncbi:YajD family HNH nuclease [Ignatzschineria sp. RMDPL8A]|uniref:YajD family HNH nuclease n=1 Tax=Ignatzschineria sp. RMDPL8A TaxID=2999236 RepID=UPI003260BD99